MNFKQPGFTAMLSKNLRRPVLIAGMLIGGATLVTGSAQAAIYNSTCSFTNSSNPGNQCLGASGIGWTSDEPGNVNPLLLGDKLLNIVSYAFDDFDNAGNPTIPTGHFDFSWLDQGTAGTSSTDTWTLRTVFDNPITGDAVTAPFNATGTLNYTLMVTDPNFYYTSIELDSAHIGTGATVIKSVAGGPTLTSTDGSSSTVPLGGTFVDVTDTYSVPAAAGINSFSNGFTQGTGVPGPLPLFGVGAAFGFSRRLRNRIKGVRQA